MALRLCAADAHRPGRALPHQCLPVRELLHRLRPLRARAVPLHPRLAPLPGDRARGDGHRPGRAAPSTRGPRHGRARRAHGPRLRAQAQCPTAERPLPALLVPVPLPAGRIRRGRAGPCRPGPRGPPATALRRATRHRTRPRRGVPIVAFVLVMWLVGDPGGRRPARAAVARDRPERRAWVHHLRLRRLRTSGGGARVPRPDADPRRRRPRPRLRTHHGRGRPAPVDLVRQLQRPALSRRTSPTGASPR